MDLTEGVALASAKAGCVLLDAAANLTGGTAGELDDVEGAAHAGGVLELVINGVLGVFGREASVAFWMLERKSSLRSSSKFLFAVPDLLGIRSSNRAVGWFCLWVRFMIPVSPCGFRRRRSWWG